ncbi:phycobiliprotein lyase [Oscillatoria salina]|uniref:phycobiliprotein lyase n=1 Tax=Oscillatoria salina TaxID=331517 RepID=UPI0013B6EA38|nr:phycobiliprotein lyase [Oscillatoria salina]MBZ8181041.1 phycobiliprotein lyase [Oscillatoria salina IIICB1]NET90416.1 phycobiliprotein lyase [Kamptonema sp. SIO1D9]
MNTNSLQNFFARCLGSWVTERTYHYLSKNPQEVERSRTEFNVNPLTSALMAKVLSDNEYQETSPREKMTGFQLDFYTISEKGEEVSQQLNALFIPQKEDNSQLEGDYLRDRAYEEERPIVSHFCFSRDRQELLMTTNYTRIVAVDSITLVNPNLRIRKILTYQRPPEGQPLEKVVLVGFGVEERVN